MASRGLGVKIDTQAALQLHLGNTRCTIPVRVIRPGILVSAHRRDRPSDFRELKRWTSTYSAWFLAPPAWQQWRSSDSRTVTVEAMPTARMDMSSTTATFTPRAGNR